MLIMLPILDEMTRGVHVLHSVKLGHTSTGGHCGGCIYWYAVELVAVGNK